MINTTLYLRGMKGSLRLLAVLAAVITMYVTIIISMYDPELMATLDGFVELMPELMAAVGMDSGANNLLEFMISYLYGFILLIFPMVFAILRGNGLVAKYVDEGSMAALIAAPVRRTTVALTQAAVLVSGTVILLGYATAVLRPAICCRSTGRCSACSFSSAASACWHPASFPIQGTASASARVFRPWPMSSTCWPMWAATPRRPNLSPFSPCLTPPALRRGRARPGPGRRCCWRPARCSMLWPWASLHGKIFPFKTAPTLTTVVYCYLNDLQAKENPI